MTAQHERGCQYEAYLTISELREGMILAQPLILSAGNRVRLSLAAGQVLDDAALQELATLGAEVACVLLVDTRDDRQREVDWARAQARIEQLFRLADPNHASTQRLREALLARGKNP
jgi:hypothetical protein